MASTNDHPPHIGEAPSGPSGVYQIDYSQIEGFAKGHDEHAGAVAQWTAADPDFAQQFLATHGKVAYSTYLNVARFCEDRVTQGTAYATRNTSTAGGLREISAMTQSADEGSAAAFQGGPVADPAAPQESS